MTRRDDLVEAMGLGPVWRLRARAPAAPAAAGSAQAPATADEGAGKDVRDAAAAHARYAVGSLADAAGPVTAPSEPGSARESGRPRPSRRPAPEDLAPVTPAPADGDRIARIAGMDWPELKAAVAGCQACALARTRTNTVFGVGDERAELLLVGEAPGAEEDARGEPFVGQAGRLLDNMLAALALRRGEGVYIANVLKCRPPQNRNPEPFEVAQCGVHLERQIDLIGPRLILAMGRFAAQTLLASDASIASLRGRLHRYRGVPAIVTYHPAYLLRNLPDKARAWEDLVLVRRTLRELGAAVRPKVE